MPDRRTVYGWVQDDREGFRARFESAVRTGCDAIAENLYEKSLEAPKVLDDGRVDSGDVQHRRVNFEIRRWFISKRFPERYAEQQKVELSGSVDIAARSLAARKAVGGGDA
jgi:hypothetical protein